VAVGHRALVGRASAGELALDFARMVRRFAGRVGGTAVLTGVLGPPGCQLIVNLGELIFCGGQGSGRR